MDEQNANPHGMTDSRFLSVVIIYEDAETSMRAMNTYGRLVLLAGDGFQFQIHVWNFKHLEDARMRNAAAAEAFGADMFIISAHCTFRPSLAVNEWMGLWRDNRTGRPGALIELLDAPSEEARVTSPIHLRLWSVACRAGLEFFSKPVTQRWEARPAAAQTAALKPGQFPPARSVPQLMAAQVASL